MRYPKGSIILSDSIDVPALRKVYQAGHITAWQLYRALHHGFDQAKWKSLARRLSTLSEKNLLGKLVVSGMGDPVFTLSEDGARAMQGRIPFFIEARSSAGLKSSRDHVWHDVELFEIQLKLRQSGVVQSWIHEPEIRADNELTSYGYAKDYDAVVTFACAGKTKTVALEYERTPKSIKHYERIAAALNKETKVNAFLYLVASVQLESFLLNGLRGVRQPVFIAQASRFATLPVEAALVNVSRHTQHRLVDCLL